VPRLVECGLIASTHPSSLQLIKHTGSTSRTCAGSRPRDQPRRPRRRVSTLSVSTWLKAEFEPGYLDWLFSLVCYNHFLRMLLPLPAGLSVLHLRLAPDCADKCFKILLARFPQLQGVGLKGPTPLTDEGMLTMAPCIRFLSFTKLNTTPPSTWALTQLKGVTTLLSYHSTDLDSEQHFQWRLDCLCNKLTRLQQLTVQDQCSSKSQ